MPLDLSFVIGHTAVGHSPLYYVTLDVTINPVISIILDFYQPMEALYKLYVHIQQNFRVGNSYRAIQYTEI